MVSKYGNRKTTINGITFDSKREAQRWDELRMLERAGHIRDLRRQVAYELVPGVKFTGDKRTKPAIRYVADFVYTERDREVIEDLKSPASANLQAFKLKRHLLLALHGREVKVVM